MFLLVTLISLSCQAFENVVLESVARDSADVIYFKKFDLASDAQIQHPNFTIEVPKGWSCTQTYDGKQSAEVLTCNPQDPQPNPSIFFAVTRRLKHTGLSHSQVFAQFKNEPKRATEMRNIGGAEWVVSTQILNLEGKNIRQWTARTNANTNEYLMLANTPNSALAKYRATIDKIFNSIILKTQR